MVVKKLPEIGDEVFGKKILVRGDIDVPIDGEIIKDATRLEDIWSTMELLLSKKCQIVLAGHLGRPNGQEIPELSTRPIAEWIGKRLQTDVAVNEEKLGSFKAFRVADSQKVEALKLHCAVRTEAQWKSGGYQNLKNVKHIKIYDKHNEIRPERN